MLYAWAVFVALLFAYLLKEAWENYHDQRRTAFWLDVAGLALVTGYIVYRVWVAIPWVADAFR